MSGIVLIAQTALVFTYYNSAAHCAYRRDIRSSQQTGGVPMNKYLMLTDELPESCRKPQPEIHARCREGTHRGASQRREELTPQPHPCHGPQQRATQLRSLCGSPSGRVFFSPSLAESVSSAGPLLRAVTSRGIVIRPWNTFSPRTALLLHSRQFSHVLRGPARYKSSRQTGGVPMNKYLMLSEGNHRGASQRCEELTDRHGRAVVRAVTRLEEVVFR